MCYCFAHLDEKTQRLGKFSESLKFLTKIQLKNGFPTIFRKFFAKNRALENNIRLQQFFPISGEGEVSVLPPSRLLSIKFKAYSAIVAVAYIFCIVTVWGSR